MAIIILLYSVLYTQYSVVLSVSVNKGGLSMIYI